MKNIQSKILKNNEKRLTIKTIKENDVLMVIKNFIGDDGTILDIETKKISGGEVITASFGKSDSYIYALHLEPSSNYMKIELFFGPAGDFVERVSLEKLMLAINESNLSMKISKALITEIDNKEYNHQISYEAIVQPLITKSLLASHIELSISILEQHSDKLISIMMDYEETA